jgi:hypothetical protein
MFSDGDVRVWAYLDNYSLYLFSLDHSLRQFCVDVILNKWFDRFILFSIIANALFLAADNPLDDTNQIVRELVFKNSTQTFYRCSLLQK